MAEEKAPAKPAETPAAEAKPAAGGSKMMLVIVGVVALLLGVGVSFLFKGGGEHPEGDKPADHPADGPDGPADGHGGAKAPGQDPVPGASIEVPEMTFPMQSPRESAYPAFKISAVIVLKGVPKKDGHEDEEAKKRSDEVKLAVESSVPWVMEVVHDIIYRIPPADRDQILYEDGAKRLADELKEIVNKRFRPQFGEDVVKEVWLPTRRPVY